MLIVVLANIATAALLFGTLRVRRIRSILVLAVLQLAAALVATAALLTLAPWPGLSPIVRWGPQTGSWLHVCWFAFSAFSGLYYATVRRGEDEGDTAVTLDARRFGSVAAFAALALIVAVAVARDRLPVLSVAGSLDGLRTTGVGFVTLVLIAAAAVANFTLPRASSIDRAVGYSLVALAAENALVLAFPGSYNAAYYIGRVLTSASSLFVLVAAVRRLIAAFGRLTDTEAALAASERHAGRQSGRLTAVWRLAKDQHLGERERFQAILDAGAAALRPGVGFYGTLRHVEGEEIVVDMISEAPAIDPHRPGNARRRGVGERMPIESTVSADIIDAGGTLAIVDFARDFDYAIRQKRTSNPNHNSLIGTTFLVGTTRYVLSFSSHRSMRDDPYTEDDFAFVDVLASFMATELNAGRRYAQLRFQIEHDQLTGLPTRSTFRAAATKSINLGIPCAVAIADLDRFREFNETFGHMLGDALLVEVAAALRGTRASGDVVARLAGDNFAVLLENVRTQSECEARLRPYCAVFSQPMLTGDRTGKETLFVGATFGAALCPQDARTFEELLARADAAVDVAKQRMRGSVAFFNQALEQTLEHRRVLHTELARAIADEQLTLHYQPTIDLITGATVGAEALVRWQHPHHGIVPPDEFIPFSERNGMIRPIGGWVISRALADIDAMPYLPDDFHCYINISGYQLSDLSFVSELREALARHPRALQHLGIEITETVAMQDADRTLNALSVLRELGIRIALDDFGTGYSSLSYLKRLPIDVIKIDKSFVNGLPDDPHDAGLIETLIAIAQRFGFRTLAEGIETPEQLAWLRERGCSYGQGYVIARPMRYEDFIEWLTSSASSLAR